MNVKITDIHYIAGLLDGEGCFGFYNNCPSIQITMTDLDTVEKARLILDVNRTNKIRMQTKGQGRQDQYALSVSGNVAIQWMMTIYSLLSIRRKAKVRDIIEKWKNRIEFKRVIKDQCIKGHPLLNEGEQFYYQTKYKTKVCWTCKRANQRKLYNENPEKYREKHNLWKIQNDNNPKRNENKIIKLIAMSRNISNDEARKLWEKDRKVN